MKNVWMKVWLSATIAFLTNSSFALQSLEVARTQVGFGSTVNDIEIIELLEKHAVSPKAVFIWASGLTGTHRAYVPMNTRQFMQDARAKAIEFFQNAIDGNDRRLSNFLNAYTGQEVSEDAALQIEARSLLNIRKQLESALSSAKSDRPIFFAVEVEGEESNLQQLRRAPLVRAYEAVEDASNRTARDTEDSLKPQAYKAEFQDPAVQTISPRDLYSVIEETVFTGMQGTQ